MLVERKDGVRAVFGLDPRKSTLFEAHPHLLWAACDPQQPIFYSPVFREFGFPVFDGPRPSPPLTSIHGRGRRCRHPCATPISKRPKSCSARKSGFWMTPSTRCRKRFAAKPGGSKEGFGRE
jgi:hypothetical protein